MIYYRLEEPILHSLCGVGVGFGYNSQSWTDLDDTLKKLRRHGAHLQKNGGNRPRSFTYKGAKTCFFVQRGLSATYPVPILTIFKTKKDVNRCLHAYTSENFLNFCTGGFPGPKIAKSW